MNCIPASASGFGSKRGCEIDPGPEQGCVERDTPPCAADVACDGADEGSGDARPPGVRSNEEEDGD